MDKMTFTCVTASGETFFLPAEAPEAEATYAQAVYTSGVVPAPALCSGLGHCGRCSMRFLSPPPEPAPEDEHVLSKEDLAAGWRLGCKHAPRSGAVVQIPEPPQRTATMRRPQRGARLCVAVDLGTTTLHWQAWEQGSTALLASGGELNPQMGAGSEVMSRLAYAARPENARKLRVLVLRRIQALLRELRGRDSEIVKLCVSGNTTMTSLLLGKPLDGLSRAPYRLDYAGGEVVDLADGLEKANEYFDIPECYIPPQLAPFVGGDVTAGLVYVRYGFEQAPPPPYLLADFGTNGEFALVLGKDKLIVASVALGPALEGIGLRHGSVARPGAVVGFDIEPAGLRPHLLPGGAVRAGDVGITGAGYLSLLHRLKGVGLLDVDGRFAEEDDPRLPPLARRFARSVAASGGKLPLELPGGRVWLWPGDVEEVLKVKAACNTALSRLLEAAGLQVHELNGLCLAGALGEHVGVRNLEGLGFIPPGFGRKVLLVGNASLAGASLLLHPDHADAYRRWACHVAAGAQVLDLAEETGFADAFFTRMKFTYVP